MSIGLAATRLLCCGVVSTGMLTDFHSDPAKSAGSVTTLRTMHFADQPVAYDVPISRELLNAEPVPTILSETDDDTSDNLSAPSAARTIQRVCRVTAYHDRGITAAGVPSGVGQCAAPGDIPFGTRLYIPALDRWFMVTDRTHKRFRHNTVDLFISSRDACKLFGRKYLECHFELPARKVRYGDPLLACRPD